VKETGILMSGDHPRKILDGTKTMTRRTYGLEKINDMPYLWGEPRYDEEVGMWLFWQQYTGDCIHIKCPYGHIGDLLWVRETHRFFSIGSLLFIGYKAGNKQIELPSLDIKYLTSSRWRPSIFTPKKYARIWREITGLRPERLQDITGADAKDEGISIAELKKTEFSKAELDSIYKGRFSYLWDSINGKKYPWAGNWWVWAISF